MISLRPAPTLQAAAAKSQRSRHKTERRELKTLVASLEEKLLATTETRAAVESDYQRCQLELQAVQHRVEMFGSAVRSH